MPEIEFMNVTKKYGNVTAVRNLNFTIYDGEYLSLLGPSGCGKTTTLRLLAGLIHPSQGKILWNGKEVQDLTPDQRNVGYVFQNFAIFPHLNVWENVAFGPTVKGYSTKDIEDLTEYYMDLVGIKDKAAWFPKDLSTPDKQRVGIARVLASGATTMLFDEPMGALDFKIREKFQDELRSITKKLGLTALHVTHDQSEAMAISDRIGVMKNGELIQIDTPKHLLFKPKTIFVNYFIGEAFFLEGVVTEVGEEYVRIETITDEFFLVTRPEPAPMKHDKVVLGIRKEFPTVKPYTGIHKDNHLHGRIIEDRFIGEKRRIIIQLQGQTIEVKSRNLETQFSTGEEVEIEITPQAISLYPYPPEGILESIAVT